MDHRDYVHFHPIDDALELLADGHADAIGFELGDDRENALMRLVPASWRRGGRNAGARRLEGLRTTGPRDHGLQDRGTNDASRGRPAGSTSFEPGSSLVCT